MQASTSGNINYVSVVNSTTTPLGSSGVFTGSSEEVIIYKSVVVSLFTDSSSATNGLSVQFSPDGTNWDFVFNFNTTGGTPFSIILQVVEAYMRIVYTNGTSAQSIFRLQTILVSSQDAPNSSFPASTITPTPVNIVSPVDAFGDLSVTEKTPSTIMSFIYNINGSIATSTVTGTATITQSNSMGNLITAASAGTALLQSTGLTKYLPGTGLRIYATGIFNSGVSGTTQLLGAGNTDNGYYFGYNGTTFSILHRSGGVNNYIPQSSWNVDTMDGNGPSKMILNPQTGNVYITQLQWLAYGGIKFFIEDPITSLPVLVHVIRYPNANTAVSLAQPAFYGRVSLTNGATSTAMTLRVACVAIYLEGNPLLRPGIKYSSLNSASVGSSVLQSILTIRNRTTFAGINNYTPIMIDLLSISSEGNKPVRFDVIRNATNAFVYTDVNTNRSVVEFSTTLATITTGVNTATIYTFYIGKSDSQVIELTSDLLSLYPGESFTIAALTTNATNENGASFSWRELF